MKKGIDISEWQSKVDYAKAKEDGVQFVILREGYGSGVIDKKFFQHVEGFKNAGIPIIGVYHFSYALTENAAVVEAERCVEHLETAGLGKDTLIFYDFEYDTINYAEKRGVSLKSKECNAFTNKFCETVEKLGYKAGVYTNIDFYRNRYNKETLVNRVLWLADYTGQPDYPCTFQQYTSKGRVNGIGGNVDMDYWFDDVPKAENVAHGKKSVDEIAREVIQGIWSAGDKRKELLEANGYSYEEVQKRVNEILAPPKKTIDEIAREVIQGKWGVGQNRVYALSRAGYDYVAVQKRVNQLL